MDRLQGRLYEGRMIGKRLRLARTSKGLTLREVGEKMGVSPQAVAQWEKSEPQLSAEKLSKLSSLLGVDHKWLDGEQGGDHEVIIDTASELLQMKVPLCTLEEAIKFRYVRTSIIGDDQIKEFSSSILIEPSHRIVGQATAIAIQEDMPDIGFKRKDIAIFDDGLRPIIGDIVLCFIFDQASIIAMFGEYIEDTSQDGPSSGRIVLYGEADDELRKLASSRESMGVAGVLVELRRLRAPGLMRNKRQKPPT